MLRLLSVVLIKGWFAGWELHGEPLHGVIVIVCFVSLYSEFSQTKQSINGENNQQINPE